MVLTYEQEKALEELKMAHKREVAELQENQTQLEHDLKMRRLDKLHQMTKDGYKTVQVDL